MTEEGVAIEVRNLTKRFGGFTAVDSLSFSVNRGEIFGFLGANGAGKSTTIRMLCGLSPPSSGTATVGGFDINTQAEQVKRGIGYMSQRFSLYNDLTVEENIRFFGGVYGLRRAQIEDRLQWVLKMAGLGQHRTRLTATLPGGWKQRLALGCAVLHQPQIVFLDEPTSGVDPLARRNFWELINNLAEGGITVLVTTHFLEEAEYCNRILLIDSGRLIAVGSPAQLKQKYIHYPILEVTCSPVIKALETLQGQSWVRDVSVFGNLLHVMVAEETTARQQIPHLLEEESIRVTHIDRITASLEDVFLYLLEGDQTTRS